MTTQPLTSACLSGFDACPSRSANQLRSGESVNGGLLCWRSVLCLLLLQWMSCCALADEPTQQIQAETVLLRLVDQVEVPARAAGLLAAIHVTEGQHVKKGALLAQIDDTDAQLMHKRAKIELDIARKNADNDVAVRSAKRTRTFSREDYQRLRALDSKLPRSVSEAELEESKLKADQSELDVEKAQHELALAVSTMDLEASEIEISRRNIEICRLVSPLNGVVVEVVRRPGEWVKSGDKVVRIIRLDRLRAEGVVPARAIRGTLVGSPVTASADLPSHPDRQFTGEIVFVSPEINPVSGQVRVWGELDNPDGLLKPGLRVKMIIRPANTKARAESGPNRHTNLARSHGSGT